MDFFPLTIDVEERAYANGRIPGSFFRREGRPSDAAILNCRLIDRPLRPSFPDGFRNETQVVITVLGADMQNPQDVLGINAASAAADALGHPLRRPHRRRPRRLLPGRHLDPAPHLRRGRRVHLRAGRGRPPHRRRRDRHHDGRGRRHREGRRATTRPAPPRSPRTSSPVASRPPRPGSASPSTSRSSWSSRPAPARPWPGPRSSTTPPRCSTEVEELGAGPLAEAGKIAVKAERNDATDAAIADLLDALAGEGKPFEGRTKEVKEAARSAPEEADPQARRRARASASTAVARPTSGPSPPRSALIPTAHGSGLFQRGETQVLNVLTLGMPKMDQMLDTLAPENRKRYMHHYNMPPHANGETGRVGSPKRREIGHGLLAERALLPVVPSMEKFPYTLRLVSEVLASNGSTSMASVCSSSLSLMDAGVPITAPVAGIAMGLIYAEGKYTTLTDILGAEDAFGDMDFKVAGTAEFVTALQLDTKIDGLPSDVLAQALQQAREARLEILERDERRHRRAPPRGRRDRPEDHQLRDPDRQDRRGHRAQGQGHQRHPAGDRRRHLRRRRRHGRHRHHRLHRRR